MSERPTTVLSIHLRGTPDFPRWVISDQFLRYFEGDNWSAQHDERKAQIFASSSHACHVVRDILVAEHQELPVRCFRAPVVIHLFSDAEISIHALKEWLSKTARLLIDNPTHGNGPVEGSLGTVEIRWDGLEEVKEVQ
jgi:hypothetical protein